MDNLSNKIIKDLLTEGSLTIQELSEINKCSRNTIAVRLALLEGQNKVKYRQIGIAKLYFLCEKTKFKETKK